MKLEVKLSFEWKAKPKEKKDEKVLKFIPEEAASNWDEIEIYPIVEDENGFCDVTTEGKESFWSVYFHQIEGGVRCIADLPTKNDALKLKQLLTKAVRTKKRNSLRL
jgi:hypothetical protein